MAVAGAEDDRRSSSTSLMQPSAPPAQHLLNPAVLAAS